MQSWHVRTVQATAWIVVSVMAASALNGILCNSRPQHDQATQCCHQDANRLATPGLSDCCKTDRNRNIPAETLAAHRGEAGSSLYAPSVVPSGTQPEQGLGLATSLPSAYDIHPHPPRGTPLLI